MSATLKIKQLCPPGYLPMRNFAESKGLPGHKIYHWILKRRIEFTRVGSFYFVKEDAKVPEEKPLKYSDDEYLNCNFYNRSESERAYTSKIVKCYKKHYCSWCEKCIRGGDKAMYERCLIDTGEGENWHTAYTCIPCLDAWIEEHR